MSAIASMGRSYGKLHRPQPRRIHQRPAGEDLSIDVKLKTNIRYTDIVDATVQKNRPALCFKLRLQCTH